MALIIAPHPIIPEDDTVTSTDKLTSAYFSDDVTQLNASDIHSASISDTNEVYYYGIAKGHTTGSVQFNVSYGNSEGKGGNTDSDAIKSPTEAVYKHWSNILLAENEVTGGFIISAPASDSAVSSGKDQELYFLTAKRTLMKDRLNKKTWTIVLSGSNHAGAASVPLSLTDDSATVNATSTPAGPRYNIVSGSQGTVVSASSARTYGWFYPDQGTLVFSGAELSRSINGKAAGATSAVVYGGANHLGFGFDNSSENDDYNNALRFINTLRVTGASMKFRDEEDQTAVSYFCRVKAKEGNFSNNPTFVSGSQNTLRNSSMLGNPTTYISGIALHSADGQVVATGQLSSPLKNNFSSEATIKVKLTY